MIDFHTHILPKIDDGSQKIGESMEMMRQEAAQKVEMVVATPHFYADQDSVHHFLKRREDSVSWLRQSLAGVSAPSLRFGAEVYYFPGIGSAELIRQLCMEGTSVLLLELPFCQWTKEMFKEINTLIKRQQLTIVLAHVERYYAYQKDLTIWNEIFALPLYAQMNAGSFLHRQTRRLAFRLLEQMGTVVLGSDCHNTNSRPPNMQEGWERIRKKFGEEKLSEIENLEKRLCGT